MDTVTTRNVLERHIFNLLGATHAVREDKMFKRAKNIVKSADMIDD